MKEIFKKKGELDYSFIDDFHVLETDGENVTMIMFERMLKKEITDSFSIESKKMSEYMRLIDFPTVEQYRDKKLLYRTVVQQIVELSKICDKRDEHRRQK